MGYISAALDPNFPAKWYFSFSRLDGRGYITCAAGPLHQTDSPARIPTISGPIDVREVKAPLSPEAVPGQELVKIEGAPGLESDPNWNWFVLPALNGLWGVGDDNTGEWIGVEIQNIDQFVLTLVDDETTQHVNDSGVLVGDVIGFLHHSNSIDKIHLKPREVHGSGVHWREGAIVLSGLDRNGSVIGIALFLAPGQ
jgi:hypothetical protein